jgi:hypothetical protein
VRGEGRARQRGVIHGSGGNAGTKARDSVCRRGASLGDGNGGSVGVDHDGSKKNRDVGRRLYI